MKTANGVVHGKVIELDREVGLPDGEEVVVTIEARTPRSESFAAGEGIKRAAGGWSDDPAGLDAYLEWNRQQRKTGRQPIEGSVSSPPC